MKKNYLFTIILAIISLNLNAQSPNWLWGKSAGGNNIEGGNNIATDANYNVYVTGLFRSASITFDSITLTNTIGNGTSNLFIVKYNSTGNAIWAKNTQGGAYPGVSIDGYGNIILVGGGGSTSFPIIFGTDTLNNSGGSCIFTVKFDPSGNVLWAKSVIGINQDWATDVTTDSNDNILITGTFNSPSVIFGLDTLHSTGMYQNVFTVKYDALGNELWARSGNNNSNSFGYGISADAGGNVYVTGSGSQILIFGTDTLTNPGSNGNAFLVKYDALGNVVWAKSPTANDDTYAYGVTSDPTGNILITGSFKGGSVTFGSITLNNANNITRDFYIVKYDPSGNVLWAKDGGGNDFEDGNNISHDSNGNIFVIGSFQSSSITFGTTTLNNSGGAGNYDIFILKYDSSGNPIWAKRLGVGGSNDLGKGICTDINGNIVITGFVSGTFNLFGSTTITNAGSSDIFVAKLSGIAGFVWPGDANADQLVNNNDLLPIGLYFGQTGSPCVIPGNVWQADAGAYWGVYQTNGADIANADCNGDGIVDANDTLAIDLNFSLAHTIETNNDEFAERLINKLFFVPTDTTYYPGDWVDIEVWAGNSTTPTSNLYGLAFNIKYTASLVQPGTESITFPISWLGTPNTDAIKVSKIDALATTAYGAITRTDHNNASGYGKIADFKFQIKPSLTTNDTLNLAFSAYRANNALGASVSFFNQAKIIVINQTNGINETSNDIGIHTSPNPFSFQTIITFDKEQKKHYCKDNRCFG